MKNRIIGLWVFVIVLSMSLTGCMAALPLVTSGLIVGETALLAIDVNEAMKSVDFKATSGISTPL